MPRAPVPGEARLDPIGRRTAAIVRNATLATLTNEQHLDALIDTGATYCIVPTSTARAFGFRSSNRIRTETTSVVGGQVVMDIHRLEYLKVGSARVPHVEFGVYNAVPGARYILVGLSFIARFRTTFDFEENRVLFRSREVSR